MMEDDIVGHYLTTYELDDTVLVDENEEEICIVAESLVNEIMKKVVDEELKKQEDNFTSPNNRKISKVKRKPSGKNIDVKKSKVDNLQIKNNKIAVENLETIIMELQENYEIRLGELNKYIQEVKYSHMKEIIEMKNTNEQVIKCAQEQLIVAKNIENENKEMKESHDKEIEEIKKENELAVKFAHYQIDLTKKKEEAYKQKEKELLNKMQEKNEEIIKMKLNMNNMEVTIENNIEVMKGDIKKRIYEINEQIEINRKKIINTNKIDVTENLKVKVNNIEKLIEKNVKKDTELPSMKEYENKLQNTNKNNNKQG